MPAGPYSVGAKGLQLVQANFNRSALAWTIDVAFADPPSGSVPVLFLPRVQRTADGRYAPAFEASFHPSNFPCSPANATARAATTCCLADFIAQYHVVASLPAPDADQCAGPHRAPPALTVSGAIFGGFGGDMPASGVAALPPAPGQPAGVSVARISVGDADMRSAASKFTQRPGGSELLESFLGMAHFTPVPGGRVLDTSVAQVRAGGAATMVHAYSYGPLRPPCRERWAPVAQARPVPPAPPTATPTQAALSMAPLDACSFLLDKCERPFSLAAAAAAAAAAAGLTPPRRCPADPPLPHQIGLLHRLQRRDRGLHLPHLHQHPSQRGDRPAAAVASAMLPSDCDPVGDLSHGTQAPFDRGGRPGGPAAKHSAKSERRQPPPPPHPPLK